MPGKFIKRKKGKGIMETLIKRMEMLGKEELELILIKLMETDKEINVGNKTKNEINKAYEKEIIGE